MVIGRCPIPIARGTRARKSRRTRTSWRPCAGKLGGVNSPVWLGSRVARKRRLRGLSSLPAAPPERSIVPTNPAQEPRKEPSHHPAESVRGDRRPYRFSAKREHRSPRWKTEAAEQVVRRES